MDYTVHAVGKSRTQLRDFHSLTHSTFLHQISRPVLELIREIGEVKIEYQFKMLKIFTGNIFS